MIERTPTTSIVPSLLTRCPRPSVLLPLLAGVLALLPAQPCLAADVQGMDKLDGCQVSRSDLQIDTRSLKDGHLLHVQVREEVRGACEVRDHNPVHVQLDGHGVAAPFTIPAGEHVLTYRLSLFLMPSGLGGVSWSTTRPAGLARHPIWTLKRENLDYPFLVSKLASPGASVRACILLHGGLTLALEEDSLFDWQPEPTPGPDGSRKWCATMPPDVAIEDVHQGRNRVTLHERGWPVPPGGPLLGVGAGFGGGSALRLRAEYEVSLGDVLVPGVAVDWDGRRGWFVTPRVEVSMPEVYGLPMLAVGVGAPWRLGSGASSVPGLQGIASVHWAVVGVLVTVDRFFGEAGDNPTVTSVLLRGSL